jgi:SAC3/GANP family/MCM3AP domain of GANP
MKPIFFKFFSKKNYLSLHFQELCSSDAVELIEKCARFHIHCSARLIAEDASVFDQKINTENLTKCLQSLKYMYNDLELRGVHCQNEAEFRAYVILLNLNDGNFLWEIKQLPSAIFKAAPVRFALDVYFAVQNNNYIKFFRLLRDTTYMNACILLRYFNQVRCKALEVIVKAFASRMPVNFTISYFTDLLAFESAEAACLFLEYYGLACSPGLDLVNLDRKAFEFPDMPFVLDRAMRVVESKRRTSVGEAIGGGPLASLDQVYQHSVHTSFTIEGYLKEGAWLAEDQNGKMARPAADTTDHRAKLTSPDEHVFKKPTISPPISPKTVLTAKPGLAGRLGARLEPPKDKPTMFGKPTPESIPGITPLFSKPASQASLFTPAPSIFAPAPSIFGGSTAEKSTSIFASAFSKPAEPAAPIFTPPLAGSIFGGQQFLSPNPSRRDIFAPKAETPVPASPASSALDTPSQPDSESLSDSGTESEKQAAPSPVWSQDSDDEEDEEQEDEDEAAAYAAQREAEIRRKLEEKLAAEQRITETAELIFQQLLDAAARAVAEETTADMLAHYEALAAIPPRLFDDILGELIFDEVLDVALEETVRKQVHLKLMRRCFRQWRTNVRDARDRMRMIESTPCWLPQRSLREQAQELRHPSQDLNLFYMARYLKGSPDILKYPAEVAAKIDIFATVAPGVFHQPATPRLLGAVKSSQQFWKLAISTPFKNEENQSDFYNYIDKFLGRAFRPDDQPPPVKRDIFFVQQRTLAEYRKTLAICVRQVRGRQLLDEFNRPESGSVENANGLLFFMTALARKEVSRERLHKCLASAERWGPCPLAVVVYESSIEHITKAKLIDHLGLDELLEQEKVSDYELIFHSTQQKLQRSIEAGLAFLAKNYSFENCLELQSQISFLGICLGEELWLRFALSGEQNQGFGERARRPDYVAELYNQAVQRVINIVSHDLGPYPDFPDELRQFVAKRVYDIPLGVEYFPPDWKSKERQAEICGFLEKCKLPALEATALTTYQALDAEINRWVQQTLTDGRTAARVANQMLQTVLAAVEALPLQPDTFGEALQLISWIPAAQTLATEHLQEQWRLHNQRLPIDIVYKKPELESYTRTPWWLADPKLAKWRHSEGAAQDEPVRKRPRLQSASLSFSRDQLNEIMAQGESSMRRASEKIDQFRKVAAETRSVSQQFDHIMYRHQRSFYENRRAWEEQMDI